MPEQDTPLMPTEPEDGSGEDEAFDAEAFRAEWEAGLVRDPRTGEVDHRATYLKLLEERIADHPDAYWDARRWQVEFLDDLTSPATGETCRVRFVVREAGEARATVEVRPGQTASPLSEADGPLPMWFVTIGRRKPRGFVQLSYALATAMGRRRHGMYDNRAAHEWFDQGDVRDLLALERLQMEREEAEAARSRERHLEWRRHAAER